MKRFNSVLKKAVAVIAIILLVLSVDLASPKKAQAWDFYFASGVQTFTAPQSGKYMLEVYGAGAVYNGLGGYSRGEVMLTAGETLYVYTGGKYGFNGGGTSYNSQYYNGGGATDIRRGADTLNNRIIVAGGGGGGLGYNYCGSGGSGGGTTGGNGGFWQDMWGQTGWTVGGYGGTQTSGGAPGIPAKADQPAPPYNQATAGTFGQGGSSYGFGGGGGWYGGGAGSCISDGDGGSRALPGGGGSGYIGGVLSGTGLMISGVWSGDGYARICEIDSDAYYLMSPQTFNYTGNYQVFTAPTTGTYRLDVYGASGGGSLGGQGGITSADYWMFKGQKIYLYVGGAGKAPDPIPGYWGGINAGWSGGGWNGGGNVEIVNAYSSKTGGMYGGYGGGGASDIRLVQGNLNSRLIVAGGGGGQGDQSNDAGGNGGGLNGSDGQQCYMRDPWTGDALYKLYGGGGTQASGGVGTSAATYYATGTSNGSFGKGSDGGEFTVLGGARPLGGGGGGGGWYGGAGGEGYQLYFRTWDGVGGGGGGSSYMDSTVLTNGTMSNGGNIGNGKIVISLKGSSLPAAPIITSPVWGSTDGSGSPTITWNFSDQTESLMQAYFEIRMSNDNKATWAFDSGIVASNSKSYTIPIKLADGNWNIELRTWFNNPNTADPPPAYGYVIIKNNTPPNAASITSYSNGQIINNNKPTITWNFSDPDPGDYQSQYQVAWSNNGWASWYGNSGVISGLANSYTVPALPDGTWQFAVMVWDNHGAQATSWGYRPNILIDTTPPNPPTISVNNISLKNRTVTLSSNDDVGSGVNHIEYSLSGTTTQGWTTYSSPFIISNEGYTTVTARVIDNAGNISNLASLDVLSQSINITLVSDTIPSDTAWEYPSSQPNNQVYPGQVINLQATTDGYAQSVSVQGSDGTNGPNMTTLNMANYTSNWLSSFTIPSNLSIGANYTLTFSAKNAYNTVVTKTLTLTVANPIGFKGPISVDHLDTSTYGPDYAPTSKIKVTLTTYGWVKSLTGNWTTVDTTPVNFTPISSTSYGETDWELEMTIPHDAPIDQNMILSIQGTGQFLTTSGVNQTISSSQSVLVANTLKITGFTITPNYANLGDTVQFTVTTTGYAESVSVVLPWDPSNPVALTGNSGYQSVWTGSYTIPTSGVTPNADTPYTLTAIAANTFKPVNQQDTLTVSLTISNLTLTMSGPIQAYPGDMPVITGVTTGKANSVKLVSVSLSQPYTGLEPIVQAESLVPLNSPPGNYETNTWTINDWVIPDDITPGTIITYTFEAQDALGLKKQATWDVKVIPVQVIITH